MKILKNIEVKLSEEEIKKIIAEKIAGELPGYTVEPEDVTLLVGTRLVGCLSLGEVYERLWFPEKDCKKEVNQKVGWIFKDDNCYFDIFDVHELYGDPEEPIYLLIFNVKDNLSE